MEMETLYFAVATVQSKISDFCEVFSGVIESVVSHCKHLIVVGDLNCNVLSTCPSTQLFINTLDIFQLQNMIRSTSNQDYSHIINPSGCHYCQQTLAPS